VPKLKIPLLSFSAFGQLTQHFSLRRRGKQTILEHKPIPTDARSPNQLIWRHMYSKCATLWHDLSEAEQQEWQSAARPKHMSGYAWFMSQCLRPNPGIYLPLQGGTMQGDIDLDSYRLLNLIDPTVDQEPATKKYHDDNLPTAAYTEGAKVKRSVNLSIPNNSWTSLPFNQEDYDNDGIHDNVTNPERLTCNTAGKYLAIAIVAWVPNNTGARGINIRKNQSTLPALFTGATTPNSTQRARLSISTVVDLAVTDYLDIKVYQHSGIALAVYAPQTRFMMQRIG